MSLLSRLRALLTGNSGQRQKGSVDPYVKDALKKAGYDLVDVLGVQGDVSQLRVSVAQEPGSSFDARLVPRRSSRYADAVREAKVYDMLSHLCIVRCHSFVQTRDYCLLVTECTPPFSIHQRLKKVGRLAEDDAKMFFYSLVRAVQHCHERHIAHRDISTHTIFVAPPRYEVKLSGFGRAVHCEPDTDTSGSTSCSVPIPPPPAAVTPNIVFVAPESSGGIATYDPFAADLWSMGVVLFTVLAGRPPFSVSAHKDDVTAARDSLYANQMWRDWHLPKAVDKALSWSCQALIWSLLEPTPAFRRTLYQCLNCMWFAEASEKEEEEEAAEEDAEDLEEEERAAAESGDSRSSLSHDDV